MCGYTFVYIGTLIFLWIPGETCINIEQFTFSFSVSLVIMGRKNFGSTEWNRKKTMISEKGFVKNEMQNVADKKWLSVSAF